MGSGRTARCWTLSDRAGNAVCGAAEKSNPVLEDRLGEMYLRRPVGRPPREGYETIVELGLYQAESWRHAQRLILVVVDQPDPRSGQRNLLPRHFFIVPQVGRQRRRMRRAWWYITASGEPSRIALASSTPRCIRSLSSPRFAANEALLLLSLLSFNWLLMLRNELEASVGGCWDLGRFQQTVLRAAGRVVRGGRRLWLDLEAAFDWGCYGRRYWLACKAGDFPKRMEDAARSIAPRLGAAARSRSSSLDVAALNCAITRNHALGERGRCARDPLQAPPNAF